MVNPQAQSAKPAMQADLRRTPQPRRDLATSVRWFTIGRRVSRERERSRSCYEPCYAGSKVQPRRGLATSARWFTVGRSTGAAVPTHRILRCPGIQSIDATHRRALVAGPCLQRVVRLTLRVMLLLAPDIAHDSGQVALAKRDDAIGRLPSEMALRSQDMIHKVLAAALDLAHKTREG